MRLPRLYQERTYQRQSARRVPDRALLTLIVSGSVSLYSPARTELAIRYTLNDYFPRIQTSFPGLKIAQPEYAGRSLNEVLLAANTYVAPSKLRKQIPKDLDDIDRLSQRLDERNAS